MTDDELVRALKELSAQEKKTASLRWTFFRGIFYGFGFFIGSALLVALFAWTLSFFDTTPVIGKYIAKIVEIVTMQTGK